MGYEKEIKEQDEKFLFLTESPYFIRREIHYGETERLLYVFEEETEDILYEAKIYIPYVKGSEYDWEFHTLQKKGNDMAIFMSSAHLLNQTRKWFQEIAQPIDHFVRLRKITR